MTVGGGARFPLRTVAVAGGGFSMVAVVLLLSLNFEALKKNIFISILEFFIHFQNEKMVYYYSGYAPIILRS